LTSLTAIFGNSQEKPVEESEKLLNLYWNRAELKKEFAELRKEQFRLQERIKQHEGAAARVQQKLNHLEQMLLDREHVHNVVAHYQFRALNLRCQSKLEKFAEQLKQQREQRQQNRELTDWNERMAEAARAVTQKIDERRSRIQTLEDKLHAERHRLVTMSGFLKFFRRRSLTTLLDSLAAQIDAARSEEERLVVEFEEIQHRPPPDTQGLDIAAKRLVNFMILAFAQQLYLHYREDGLVSMAKEAAEKSVGAIRYGSKKDCDELLARLQKRADSFDKASNFADILQKRAKLIAEHAKFRSNTDAVPMSRTVSTAYEISESGVARKSDANLLGENYWKLAEILSR
jgi:chromosome segregation ATPase